MFWFLLDVFVSDNRWLIDSKQNKKSSAVHQKELTGPLVGLDIHRTLYFFIYLSPDCSSKKNPRFQKYCYVIILVIIYLLYCCSWVTRSLESQILTRKNIFFKEPILYKNFCLKTLNKSWILFIMLLRFRLVFIAWSNTIWRI